MGDFCERRTADACVGMQRPRSCHIARRPLFVDSSYQEDKQECDEGLGKNAQKFAAVAPSLINPALRQEVEKPFKSILEKARKSGSTTKLSADEVSSF